MQLKKGQSIRGALATATCTLLGTHANDVAAFGTEAPWEFDSAILYYSEDQRVSAVEPVLKARKELDTNEFLNLRLVVDVLTGASANGAVPMPFAQTFTTPSGDSTYTTSADETPLDPSFKDTRGALSVDWEKPINRTLRGVYGAYFSREFDYTSLGGSATFSKDTEDKNRTYTAGIAASYDLVSPVGGAPVELSPMPDSGAKQVSDTNETKTVVDFLFGITQVLSRKSLLQLNYTIGSNNGYLTDPYKILSVIDSNSGEIIATDPYRFEARPDNRLSQSVYAKYNHQFNEDVIYLTYRFFWDDWGINSHTVDLRYRFELGGGHYLQPHARYYVQSKAEFYKPYLLDSEAGTTQAASADYRLGDMTTTTLGLAYGIEFSQKSEFTIRAEVMKQSGDEPAKFGALNDQILFPDVDAIIVQAGYSFQF
ncbi:MAG: DUF3570 domain-containing protein [Gammaproteobacteria bacterium]|nr:DUF3570 domain-containing protein [Gammaproteobacteria bacterium]